jgi:hypothetical protein
MMMRLLIEYEIADTVRLITPFRSLEARTVTVAAIKRMAEVLLEYIDGLGVPVEQLEDGGEDETLD